MRRTPQQHRAARRRERGIQPVPSPIAVTLARMNTFAARRLFRWAGFALLLLAGLVALSGARPTPAYGVALAPAQPAPAPARARPALEPGGPDLHHWVDSATGAAYSVRIRTSRAGPAGQFTFTLPNGDQIAGGSGDFRDPLQPSPASDGTFIQQTNCGDDVSDVGQLILANQTAGVVATGLAAPGTGQPVRYVLSAHLDASGFMAYATLDYATAKDPLQASLCLEKPPYRYVVQAGCDLVACLDPQQSATQDAQRYDDAMIAAARNGSASAWQAVYPLTATFIQGQYPPGDFGNAMAAQERSVGRITKIENKSAPDVRLDVAMQPFFRVAQDMTVEKNGQAKEYHVTSYYLLEGQHWRFWFSA